MNKLNQENRKTCILKSIKSFNENKEDTNEKLQGIRGLEVINTLKMIPRMLYRLKPIYIKIPIIFLLKKFKKNSKIQKEPEMTPNIQSNLEKESKHESIIIPDFRIYYKVILTKIETYWHEDRRVDQCNIIKRPEINSCTYGQLIIHKGTKNKQ